MIISLLSFIYVAALQGIAFAFENKRADLLDKALFLVKAPLSLTNTESSPLQGEVSTAIACVDLEYAYERGNIMAEQSLGIEAIYTSKSEESACFILHGEWARIEVITFALRALHAPTLSTAIVVLKLLRHQQLELRQPSWSKCQQ